MSMTTAQCEALFQKAHEAGMLSAKLKVPTPMVVQQRANPLDDSSEVVQSWQVDSGVCGFAWVIIRPGNCVFANWMKKNNKARPDSYYGGVNYWVGDFGQSMERKEAYANSFARVLCEAGIRAYAMSRLD